MFPAALEVEEDDDRAAEEGAAEEGTVEDEDEVIEVNNNEVEEDLRDMSMLWYDSTFEVILKREEKGVVNRRFQGTAPAFTDARLFAIQMCLVASLWYRG